MLYPVYIHVGDESHAHGITIPDFTGCFSAADTWDEIQRNVQEAVELYCDGEDMVIPKPSPMESLINNKDYQEGVWLMVDINTNKLLGKVRRINITIPEYALQSIDKTAKQLGVTRSEFLTHSALKAIENTPP